ncbi:MAG: hypothetical protein J6X69_02110 [Bacteroidales bacterium]|nr:hypothetical protein [Bacteroidales bacterium]
MRKSYVPTSRTYTAPRASEVKFCQERSFLQVSSTVELTDFGAKDVYNEEF